MLFFERVDTPDVLDLSELPMQSDPAVLCEDTNISRSVPLQPESVHRIHADGTPLRSARDRSLIKHQPLRRDELPRQGTLIAIDAEFVSLQQEEAEFHSDGTKKVLRPSRQVLARVSVLRGEGVETGIPFIDDHIHTGEPIVDYLTEFSGIRGESRRRSDCVGKDHANTGSLCCTAGDLDPQHSRHTLVPLKVAYKKLRMLVDLGCVFIGHGLNKDFRIISQSTTTSVNFSIPLTVTPVRHLRAARPDYRYGQHLPPPATTAEALAPLPRLRGPALEYPGRHA